MRESKPLSRSVYKALQSTQLDFRYGQLHHLLLGFVIGVITEGLTGQGIIHQIGLGPLVDGYAACHTSLLPFCG
ncbi:MAG: hypothetical protein EBU42_02240 [Synechococcus sp.]|nr:hypothetical protein [Synechococcus sp.]